MEKYPNARKVDPDAMGGKVVECEIEGQYKLLLRSVRIRANIRK